MSKSEIEKKIDATLALALDDPELDEKGLELLEKKVNTIRKLAKPDGGE